MRDDSCGYGSNHSWGSMIFYTALYSRIPNCSYFTHNWLRHLWIIGMYHDCDGWFCDWWCWDPCDTDWRSSHPWILVTYQIQSGIHFIIIMYVLMHLHGGCPICDVSNSWFKVIDLSHFPRHFLNFFSSDNPSSYFCTHSHGTLYFVTGNILYTTRSIHDIVWCTLCQSIYGNTQICHLCKNWKWIYCLTFFIV